jgi:hypothetical protein
MLVALASGQDRRHDSTPAAAEYLDQLTHLAAHVRIYGTGVGKMKSAGDTASEGICDKGALVRPPAIYRGLSYLSPSGDFFDRKVSESNFA